MFKGRKLVIATKHHKERVIAPLLEDAIGVSCFVPEHFDTDTLGTFSGEIKRLDDPLRTARKKCLEAMALTNCDLGVASEGSFGPHPSLPFASGDDEFLIFIDKKNNLEIVARELSLDTNFNGQAVKSEAELLAFAEHVKFPSHALIVKPNKTSKADIIKDITSIEILKSAFQKTVVKYQSVYIETDMRAMYNPTRMAVIKKTAQRLISLIASTCPECDTPGFSAKTANKGLPCSLCGYPTDSTLSVIYKCQKCHFEKEEFHPNGKSTEDPMFCNYCNP